MLRLWCYDCHHRSYQITRDAAAFLHHRSGAHHSELDAASQAFKMRAVQLPCWFQKGFDLVPCCTRGRHSMVYRGFLSILSVMTPSCCVCGVMIVIIGLIRSPETLQRFCITDQVLIIQSLMQQARRSKCKLYSCRVGFKKASIWSLAALGVGIPWFTEVFCQS